MVGRGNAETLRGDELPDGVARSEIFSLGDMEARGKVDSVEREGRPDKVLNPCFGAVGVDAQSCLQVDVHIAVAEAVGVEERDGDELEVRRGSDPGCQGRLRNLSGA
jgi:hypothetical protein